MTGNLTSLTSTVPLWSLLISLFQATAAVNQFAAVAVPTYDTHGYARQRKWLANMANPSRDLLLADDGAPQL